MALTADCNNPPNGTIGVPYSHTILASGGSPPYSFMLTGGALPGGLSLDVQTGVISGTPLGPPGTFPFQITVLETTD
jgi:large repetitive protein